MVRLRELAAVAALSMLGMGVALNASAFVAVGTDFKPALRVASAQADFALQVAAGQPAPLALPTAPDPALDLQADAADRLRGKIPPELYSYFDVYLYVSKAAAGSLAQHMYIFRKGAANALVFEQSFPVSTGRERHERYFTSTPDGLFELDPNRFEVSHYSRTWHAHMPWAMFLNASFHGRMTGVALHSSGNAHAALLGSRASGGCVRLPPDKAAGLFQRFQAEEQGMVPVFAYDIVRDRTGADGVLVRDANGRPVLTPGYRVLLFIEDYEGGPALVAMVTSPAMARATASATLMPSTAADRIPPAKPAPSPAG
jgi:L,D-transpeptidase catalytic domain